MYYVANSLLYMCQQGLTWNSGVEFSHKLTINMKIGHKKVAAFFPEIILLSSLMQTILHL